LGTITAKGVDSVEKEKKKPKVLPHPLPVKPGIVEPIIAAGEMKCPSPKGIISDPEGSYTGRPFDGGKPVQDVDDL
jgi:hypothetical protein